MKGIIEVDLSQGCRKCPLGDHEETFNPRCVVFAHGGHNYNDYKIDLDSKEVPEWCPFRKGKIFWY